MLEITIENHEVFEIDENSMVMHFTRVLGPCGQMSTVTPQQWLSTKLTFRDKLFVIVKARLFIPIHKSSNRIIIEC